MALSPPVPVSYVAWRHCIEQDCRQPLTAEFIATRLTGLRDANDAHTREFARLYGAAHLAAVTAWFEQAAAELGSR